MKPFVTICVPTYNKSAYLKESLLSLLNQNFGDFKLIVVDDASADNTREVVESFHDLRMNYVRNSSRLGMTSNWNRSLELGLKEKGQYLAIYHHDDCYSPRLLSTEVEFLESNPKAGLVHTAAYLKEEQTGYRLLKRPYLQDRTISAMELLDDLCRHLNYHITTPSVLARKDAYLRAGKFDSAFKICPDLDLWWRMLEFYDLGYIAEPLVTIRISPGQVSSSKLAAENAITQKETLKHLEKAIRRLKSKHRNFDDEYYLSKAKHYCARKVLRVAARAISASNPERVRMGCKRAVELSREYDIILGILMLKMFNNRLGGNILAALSRAWIYYISRKVLRS